MRCLHCGKRLPLLRKFTDVEFCSEDHRKAYTREQEQLALSRLIDAQQQSQVVSRRKDKEKKKASPPAIEPSAEKLGPFARLEPELLEASWHGYQKEDSDPLCADPLVTLPRMDAAVHACSVPVSAAVWWDVSVVSCRMAGVPARVEAVSECAPAAPSSLHALEAWEGSSFAWKDAVAPDLRVVGVSAANVSAANVGAASVNSANRAPAGAAGADPVAACSAPQAPRVGIAGSVAWQVSIPVRQGAFPSRPVISKPAALRTGWLPDAFPRAGLRVVAVEQPAGRDARLDQSRRLLPVAPPCARNAAAERRAMQAEPEFRCAAAVPPGPGKPAAALRQPGSTRLDVGEWAVGKRDHMDFREPALSPAVQCVLPAEHRPDRNSGLRLAPQVTIRIPQANWGWRLVPCIGNPELPPAFLVPPRAAGLRLIEFTPPIYGMQALRLSVTTADEPDRWRIGYIEGPFWPVPKVTARPGFSCPPLCDWVPVRGQMMPLCCTIQPRAQAHAPDAGIREPEDAGLGVAAGPDAPTCGLRLAGGPGFGATACKLRRISIDGMAPQQAGHQPKAELGDEPIIGSRAVPAPKLRIAKDRPTLEIERRLNAPAWKKSLYRADEAWRSLPISSRLAGFLTVVAVGVALTTTSPSKGSGPAGFQASIETGWQSVHQNILRRAAVALTDDFRTGLGEWKGKGDWARSWSYDQAGFVRTGPLALYRPSLQLTDYRMEFLGQIEKKSLGWIVRAADADNYQAVKLTVTAPGPVPVVALQRYVVLGGKAGPVTSKRLPMQLRMDTMYRVQMEVRGPNFSVSVQDQIVDWWEDTRLRRGGIGFFSGSGELARLRWVGVWHQYDTLGRLCALLAPPSIADRNTGVSQ